MGLCIIMALSNGQGEVLSILLLNRITCECSNQSFYSAGCSLQNCLLSRDGMPAACAASGTHQQSALIDEWKLFDVHCTPKIKGLP